MNKNNEPKDELGICQEQIRQMKLENEDLVQSLLNVNQKLHDSEELKGHFISNITNEIVNPFASILALAQNIRQLKEGEMTHAHRMAELIFSEAFHLDFQLKNIFAAALIEAGKVDLKPTSFRPEEIGEELSRYFQDPLGKKQIRLSFESLNTKSPDEPVLFVSDKEKIDLILKNLISNSIKYSPEKSVIDLKIGFIKGRLTIEVSDHGKGINITDRKVIFDRFKQLDEKINSINTGHGLGLSIVQSYAEMLGGKVSLDENYHEGLRIVVSIPESDKVDTWDDLENFIFDTEASF